MDNISVQIDTKDLEEKLKALPQKTARKYMRKALQASGEVILEPMVMLAPERTDEPTPDGNSLPPGILKADLQVQVTLNDNGGKVRVGPGELAGHVARWQNNGWVVTGHKPGKKKITEKAGKHFMESAYDESAEAALDAFINTLAEQIYGDTE